MGSGQTGHAVKDGAIRLEQATQESAIDSGVVRLEDRGRNPRNPALAAVVGVGQALGEPGGLPPACQPDRLKGQFLISLLGCYRGLQSEQFLGENTQASGDIQV